jgi:hypothetical protein
MASSRYGSGRRVHETALALGIVGLLAGCGGDGVDAVPVSGRITVNGEALQSKGGVVNLVPNKDKGNTTTLEPVGTVDENGVYTVYYAKGKKGAPPGWYRVQVSAMPPGDQPPPMPRPRRRGSPPPPPPLFKLKYTRANDSGLEIEVVRDPAPGAYDLKLSK